MKFRYIITDISTGTLAGTNDEDTAISCAQSEDFFVYDAQSAVWLALGVDGVEKMEIEEYQS